MPSPAPCPACASPLAAGLRDWHRVCPACGYEGSTLRPRILEQPEGGALDEAARADGLADLRRRNFATLATLIARELAATPTVTSTGGAARPRLLDVGCAHGWFLETVAADHDTVGIEPDRAIAAATRARGIAVREGFFPEALHADERFDVIVFNDVLEHIPDIAATLAAGARHLVPGGLLVVNAPDRRGALYRIAKAMLRLGLPASFDRLWQKGFPSPHVHYFDTRTLHALAAPHGLRPAGEYRLPSLSARGLYARVRYAGDVSAPKAAAITVAVGATIPVLALLPSDITAWLFRRE